jgi:hypothetical protein
MQRRRDPESIECSQSYAQIPEESLREEHDAMEDDFNSLRDKLAAATIELQQTEDEIEMKVRETDELVSEHDRIVEVVEQEWRGAVEETKGQVEELRDVSFIILYTHFLMKLSVVGLSRTRDGTERTLSEHLQAQGEHERPAREI